MRRFLQHQKYVIRSNENVLENILVEVESRKLDHKRQSNLEIEFYTLKTASCYRSRCMEY